MGLNGVASGILVGVFIFESLIVLAVLCAMAFVIWKLNQKIEQLTPKVEPLLDKVDQALSTANNKLAAIGDRTEHIVAQGEEVAVNVHHKVDKTAATVQRAVNAPLITLNSLAAGVSRGVATFRHLQQGRGGTKRLPQSSVPAKSTLGNNGNAVIVRSEGGVTTPVTTVSVSKETFHGR